MTIEIKMTVKIDEQRIVDTLINALEGSCDYWIQEHAIGGDGDHEQRLKEVVKGKMVLNIQENDRNEDKFFVTKSTIIEGLQKMADKYDWHFKNLIDENDDAETADVLLQLCTFGRIIYG